MPKGLLIDYRWCTGCHSCEVACQKEHDYPPTQFGIKLVEFIWPIDDSCDWQSIKRWQYTYLPMPLDLCDLCKERTEQGKLPSCVQHCQAQCISYGDIEELKEKMLSHPQQSLFYLGE